MMAGRPPAAATAICFSQFLRVEGWKGGFSKKGPNGDGDYSGVGGWKGGFSKKEQAEMEMTYHSCL